MKSVMTGTYNKGKKSFNFNFYTDISATDKIKFVNSVVNILVDDKSYNSIVRDLVFDFYIIDIFSDINTTELKEVSFVKNAEEFLEETNIVDIIKANAKIGLIEELNHAVNQSIEYRTGIHLNPLNEALTSLINTLEKKINDVDLVSMMEMAAKFSGMTEEFTPENIVKAYMTTDTYKKNMVELEEVKKQRTEFAEDIDKAIQIVGKK